MLLGNLIAVTQRQVLEPATISQALPKPALLETVVDTELS
jgi:hypothetical protein